MTDLRFLQIDYSTPPDDGDVLSFDESSGLWTISPIETWTPSYQAGLSSTFTSPTLHHAEFKRLGLYILFLLSVTGTYGGSADNRFRFSLPVAAQSGTFPSFSAEISYAGGPLGGFGRLESTTEATVREYAAANITAGTVKFSVSGFYKASA